MTLGGQTVMAASAGTLAGERCEIADEGLIGRCLIGKGRAIVIADADLLNIGSDPRDDRNLAALLSQLESLSR
jgi:hypothetical protein